MTPLEKHCRRVVRLLPPKERDARGEEVLGVLMDLSAGRARPPVAEVLAVAGLAARQRLLARADRLLGALPVLAAALVVMTATLQAATAVRWLPWPDGSVLPIVGWSGLWLAASVGWLLGFRPARVLWWLLVGYLVVGNVVLGVGDGFSLWITLTLPHVAAAVVVGATTWWRAPAPRSRSAWLLLLAAAFGGHVAVLYYDPGFVPGPTEAAVAVAVTVLAAVLVLSGRRRFAGAAPAVVVVPLTVIGVVPAWLGVTVVTAAAGLALCGRPARRPAGQPSTATA